MASSLPGVMAQLRQLKAAWPARGWSYDSRFECVATSFDREFAAQARALLQPLFPTAFTERSLATASEEIRAIAERTGGLRAAQLVLGGAFDGRVTPYVLWWPWDEAPTISVRLGLDAATPAELEELCDCFAIAR